MGRIYFAVMDALRPRRPVYPQDLRFFWRALAEIGIGLEPAIASASTDEVMSSVLARVRQVLGFGRHGVLTR
jgi:hypothetical protein